MTDRLALPRWAYLLGAVLLVYLAVFIGFAGTGARAVASGATLVVDSGLWLASGWLALGIARRAEPPSRGLMLLLSVTGLAMAVADGAWNVSELIPSCDLRLHLNRAQVVSETLFNLGWILFLGALVFAVFSSWRPRASSVVTVSILIPIVVGIFAITYGSALDVEDFAFRCAPIVREGVAAEVRHHLALVNVGTQAAGVAVAAAVMMVPLLAVYRVVVIAYLILVAADFVMWTKLEVGGAAGFYWNLVWILAAILVFVGLKVCHDQVRAGRRLRSPVPEIATPNQSRLTGPVTLVMIVPMAVMVLLGVLIVDPGYLVAVSFLMLMMVLIVASEAAGRAEAGFDRFVDTLVGRITHRPLPPPTDADRLFYEVTNLDFTARQLDERLGGGLDRLLVVGEESRFALEPPEDQDDAPPTCFVIMPFGPEWSGQVHETIERVVKARGYQCVRGDDFFGANEIMDDVWTQMRRARLLIADLTGRNPNVFYEVGMAHTLGLPTVLLSQSVDDIPFDLASRRVIQYDLAHGTERLARALDLAVVELSRINLTRRDRDAPGRPDATEGE